MNYGYGYNPAAAAAAFYPAGAAAAAVIPHQPVPQVSQQRFVAPAAAPQPQFNQNFNKYPQNPGAVNYQGGNYNNQPKPNTQPQQSYSKPTYGNFVPAGAKPTGSNYSSGGNRGQGNFNQGSNSHNEKFEKAVINAAISVAQ